ncbi:S8 family serine peptidase [Phaeodactylibacter luteus]|uniref:S8 family serine peptidase n=1 Tax=Phaeodactylibacter luteus TaxID=1564516 RepID=A0A5C6RMB8_9BACT|nr:S8 family serine peptidase [Phaeodactylibacter luteus]TXB63518.1 S8 family serine peptidase [Phaeodactylibacter luteus]
MENQAIISVSSLLSIILLLLLPAAAQSQQQGIPGEYYEGRVYVKIQEAAGVQWANMDSLQDLSAYGPFAELFRAFGVYRIHKPFGRLSSSFFDHTYQLHFSETGKEQAFIQLLMREPAVEFAEQVPVMRSFYTPNDAYANNSDQWFLAQIDAYDAWDLHQEGEEVVVAITDDAVKWDHEDLEGNLWINEAEYVGIEGIDDDGNGYIDDYIGWDAANWDNDPRPPAYASSAVFSHGTHCAGIAGAVTDNWVGGASISFNNARIMSCKGKLDGTTGTGIDEAWGAFAYAVAAGAEIISCSWGGSFSVVNSNLVSLAIDNGAIVVAAAGNDNTSIPSYPAAYTGVLAVANTRSGDVRNPSSNYGSWVDIAAPGTDILSPIAFNQSSYDAFNGTSMSCPMVAGLLAHMKSYKPNAANEEIIGCLLSSADNIDVVNPGFVGALGSGRINARAALECLDGGGGGGCNGIALGLTITLDDYGDETTWGIFQAGNLVAYGGPYEGDAEGEVIQEEVCLQEGCYDLFFFDDFGDGMCCDFGEGGYTLSLPNGEVLASGGSFEEEEVTPFCVSGDGGGSGCPPPGDLHALEVGYSHAYLDWSPVSGGADAYRTRFKTEGQTGWITGSWFTSTSTIWGNMQPCRDYEFQVQSRCDGAEGEFSSSVLLSTRGCADAYCYSYGTTWDDWIARVQLKEIDHETGKSYGFGDYMSLSAGLEQGAQYPLTLTPDTDDNQQTVYWRVWIDFNQDGDFQDANELVFQESAMNTIPVSGAINIPGDAPVGATRMRVSMDPNGFAGPCSTGSAREVEDYTVVINEGSPTSSSLEEGAAALVQVFPNPAREKLHVQLVGAIYGSASFSLLNAQGQVVRQWPGLLVSESQAVSLGVSGLPPGLFWLEVNWASSRAVKKIVIH